MGKSKSAILKARKRLKSIGIDKGKASRPNKSSLPPHLKPRQAKQWVRSKVDEVNSAFDSMRPGLVLRTRSCPSYAPSNPDGISNNEEQLNVIESAQNQAKIKEAQRAEVNAKVSTIVEDFVSVEMK